MVHERASGATDALPAASAARRSRLRSRASCLVGDLAEGSGEKFGNSFLENVLLGRASRFRVRKGGVLKQDENLTGILRQWAAGDPQAADRIFEQLYPELKGLARKQLSAERAGHTIQPTALVNEAYLKLSRGANVEWQDRAHFMAIAARAIRQILIDYGRRRNAARRSGGMAVTLNEALHGELPDALELIALDDALNRLEAINARQAEIVALRYFGGMSIEEIAVVTGQSESTVGRQWRAARAWLYRALGST